SAARGRSRSRRAPARRHRRRSCRRPGRRRRGPGGAGASGTRWAGTLPSARPRCQTHDSLAAVAAVLIVLGLFLVLALLSGIPRILQLPGLPRVLAFEEVPDSALTPVQATHLSKLDAACGTLHYRPVFNIRVTNLPNANLSRFYLSSADPALILTSLLRVKTGKEGDRSADYVEIITRYRDGTYLATSSSGTRTPFDLPPRRVVQKFPGLDVARLKERHDQAA